MNAEWKLHESTQRALCRMSFILLGLLPLGMCLTFCAIQVVPGYQRWHSARWEDWLSSQMGLTVTIDQVEWLSPESFELSGLGLKHPETNASIGHVESMLVHLTKGKWMIDIREAELESRQLSASWRILHDWFLCRPKRFQRASEIHIAKLTLRDQDQPRVAPQALQELSVKLFPEADAVLAAITFAFEENGDTSSTANSALEATRSSILIKRYHNESQLLTHMQLRMATPLPCSLAAPLLPQLALLGDGASFFVEVCDARFRENSWDAMISNTVVEAVDFGKLTQGTQLRATGLGRLVLNSVSCDSQRIRKLEGQVAMRSGAISAASLSSLRDWLGVQLRPLNSVDHVSFDEAKLAFLLEPQEIHLAVDVRDSLGPLALRGNWNQPLPAANLSAALQGNTITEGDWLALGVRNWLFYANPEVPTSRISQHHSVVSPR